MNEIRDKYQKYKNKYNLELKRQSGGKILNLELINIITDSKYIESRFQLQSINIKNTPYLKIIDRKYNRVYFQEKLPNRTYFFTIILRI